METKVRKLDRRSVVNYIVNAFPIISLIVVIVFFAIVTDGRSIAQRNYSALLGEGYIIILGAIGFSFPMMQGKMDFSIGSTMAMACVFAAYAAQINLLLGVLVGVLTGVVVGAINGFLHVKLHMDAFIATIGMQYVIIGIVAVMLGGGRVSAPFEMLKWNTDELKLITVIVIAIVGYFLFERFSFGKRCRAIGSCQEMARQSGVNIGLICFLPFLISGGISGLLGAFSLMRTGMASLHSGDGFLLNVLTAILMGGMPITGGSASKFRAPILGALTVTVLSNGMSILGVSNYDSQLIKGIIFLLAIAISFDRRNVRVIK